MSSPYHEMFEQAMADYAQRREGTVQAHQQLNSLTETVTAPRQVVQITVAAHGNVTAIRFPTHAYKSLPAPELAAVIMKTMSEAQDRVRRKSVALLQPLLPDHVSAEALLRGELSPEALLPPDISDDREVGTAWFGMGSNHE